MGGFTQKSHQILVAETHRFFLFEVHAAILASETINISVIMRRSSISVHSTTTSLIDSPSAATGIGMLRSLSSPSSFSSNREDVEDFQSVTRGRSTNQFRWRWCRWNAASTTIVLSILATTILISLHVKPRENEVAILSGPSQNQNLDEAEKADEMDGHERDKLLEKLKISIKKRNRLLDTLMMQQNQQSLILNRQKHILNFIEKEKLLK